MRANWLRHYRQYVGYGWRGIPNRLGHGVEKAQTSCASIQQIICWPWTTPTGSQFIKSKEWNETVFLTKSMHWLLWRSEMSNDYFCQDLVWPSLQVLSGIVYIIDDLGSPLPPQVPMTSAAITHGDIPAELYAQSNSPLRVLLQVTMVRGSPSFPLNLLAETGRYGDVGVCTIDAAMLVSSGDSLLFDGWQT